MALRKYIFTIKFISFHTFSLTTYVYYDNLLYIINSLIGLNDIKTVLPHVLVEVWENYVLPV